jgi:UDP-glucose:tetrahydrobiopterin glucosyltransferase
MRIGMVAPLVTPIAEPQRGGSQAIVSDLAAALTERGHDVVVFAANGSSIPGVDVREVADAADLSETLFRDGRRAPVSAAADAAFARVARAVRSGSFDVVHNHAFDVPAVLALGSITVPVVHSVHLPPTADMAAALREGLARGRVRAVATVSLAQHEAWRRAGVPNTAVPDGVPTARIPWSASPGVGALFAGRFTEEKGVLDAIHIARAAGLPLSLAGWPYDPAFAECELRPLVDGSDVTILGSVARVRLWRWMAASAVVLCPARWDEPFGLVAAEAQAAGTPVVGYRRGALAEVVLDGATGYLVDEGDLTAAATAVGRALRLDRPACRLHAETDLDLGAMVTLVERLYADAMDPGMAASG